jgi:hypothetical protein
MDTLVKPLLELAKALCPCSDFAKYVCNAMHLKSGCCGASGSCCDFELDTDLVELPTDTDSELSVELGGCFEVRHSH